MTNTAISIKNAANLTYGFVGLGLMGGSFAKAIQSRILNETKGVGSIVACDLQEETLELAIKTGVIHKGYAIKNVQEMLALCDVVFICLYPLATIDFLERYKDAFKKNALITDIAGVKSTIIKKLPNILREDLDFMCAHPMAGKEKGGFLEADAQIFKDRNYILIARNENTESHLDFFKWFVAKLGFKHLVVTDAQTHDHKIAFTSQLCHVIASALVDSAEDANITEFGGGSFESLTRIAMLNAPMWTELFSENKKELLLHIDSFEKSLEYLKELLEHNKTDELCKVLKQVREKRTLMARKE